MKGLKTNPVPVCIIVTAIAVFGAFISFATGNVIWILAMMLPAVGYEMIRTEEGASTKFSSILLGIVLVLEIILILFKVNYDLAKFLGEEEKYVGGYYVPLGDVKVFGPILTAILSVILLFRTYGIYTKWLSVVIAVGSLAAVYMLNPTFFSSIVKIIVNGLFDRLGSSL